MSRFSGSTSTASVRVALLTNSLSPHTLPLCEGISERVRELRAFVSAASDSFHHFPRPSASFQIIVQRSFNALRLRHRTEQFSISEPVHLPLGTFSQLVRYKPDVILSGQFGARTLFAIFYRMVRPRVRLILWAALSSHTERERSRSRQAMRRWMLRRVDGAFVNGKSGEAYLRALGFTGRFCTIPYVIEDTLFQSTSYEPKPQKLRLLFCGRVDETKGILRFSRVLHRWCTDHPEQNVQLKIVGDGPDRDAIKALTPLDNLDLCLLPRMDRTELATHYHQADIFAFPSLMDEWGVVVNEAMSAGLPVLGSIYSQAVVELVCDGESGWLCDGQSETSIYDTLSRALGTSGAQLKTMSAYARCTVNEISPEIIARRAVQAIAEVCGVLTGAPQRVRSADARLASTAAVSSS